jgi:hypothetical protein
MYCPKCGNADQTPESYCRQCGIFLPDLSKPGKTPVRPEEHVKANAVLSAMTIVTSFTLSILLYWRYLGQDGTPLIIYVTAGFLIAMGCWQIQTLWRTLLLRRHFDRNKRVDDEVIAIDTVTDKRLKEASFDDIVPASVTERTTRHLQEQRPRSSEAEQ